VAIVFVAGHLYVVLFAQRRRLRAKVMAAAAA